MKNKIILFLVPLFLLINGSVYFFTQNNGNQRIQLALDRNLKNLKTHYEILLQAQKITALTLYESTIELDKFIQIMSQALDSTEEERAKLRVKLQIFLVSKYKRAIQKGVLQYHFVFPNNESFLRMHKPSKFGDDLTEIRYDFKYVNATKQPIRGFTQGRTSHGFRNTFPISDKNGKHLGAMEISFSSDTIQWYLNNISHIHTHFLVDKKIFEAKTWERDDLVLEYTQSSENLKFMLALGDTHDEDRCIKENKIRLDSVKEEIVAKMLKGDTFSSYTKDFEHVDVFSFLPIENMKHKTVAWLVSYEESPFIELTLKICLL